MDDTLYVFHCFRVSLSTHPSLPPLKWRRRLTEFNRDYVKPFLTTAASGTSRGEELVEEYDRVNAFEGQRARLLRAMATENCLADDCQEDDCIGRNGLHYFHTSYND